MPECVKQPWPWYVAGPLIGLFVPLLLLMGNKKFGISSSLRHICAACFPAGIPFFSYKWKTVAWNLFFATGILAGGIIAAQFLNNGLPIDIHPGLNEELQQYGLHDRSYLLPPEIFSLASLGTFKGFLFIVVGGFLVGFGTRYAGGCTSGHSIMGLSNLQWPSLVATICFMAGGILVANFVIPLVLK